MSKGWRYKVGAYGHRVVLFERKDRTTLYAKYTDPQRGRIVQYSLGHDDQEQAIQDGQAISDALRMKRTPARLLAEAPRRIAEPSFPVLFRLYRKKRSAKKRGRGPKEDARRVRIFTHFFAQHAVRRPSELDDDLIETFIDARLHGDLQVPNVSLPSPAPQPTNGERRDTVVTHRTVDADLVFLASVINWAKKKRIRGRTLLTADTIRIPRVYGPPKNEDKPLMNHDHHLELLKVADDVDDQRLFGCFLRLLDGLGWRVAGLCHMRASDLDFTAGPFHPYGQIRKNHLVDKTGHGQWVPLSRHTRATLNRLLARRALDLGDDAFLFHLSVNHPDKPWSRWRFYDLLRKAERAAELDHVGGAHAWRRKWATERKDHPAPDVMAAGGWNDRVTFERAYSLPDKETTFQVVARPTRRVRRGA